MPGLLTAKELREKRQNLHQQYQAVLDRAAEEDRELSSEDREVLDRIDAKDEELQADIERVEKHEARQAELAESMDRKNNGPAPTVTSPPSGETRGQPSGGERADRPYGTTPEERERVNESLRRWSLNEHSPEDLQQIRNAGFELDRTGKQIHLKLWDSKREKEHRRAWMRGEERAQSTTDASGGFTIPETLVRTVESALLDFGGMRESGATIIRTDSGEKMTFPVVDDTSNTGRLLSENTAVTTTDITFAEKQLDAYKYSSDQILASVELLQDTAIDMPTFIGEKLGERIGRITNQHFTTGTGSSQPNGIVTAATSQATTANATTVTYDELQDLLHGVDPAYRRQNARWMFSDSTLKVVKQLKDGQGRPLWVPGLAVREPDSLLGYPYTVNQDVADIAASAKAILFGAFRYYHIRDVLGVTLLRLDERYADKLQVAWIAFSRHDGELISNGTPVKFLTQSA